MATQTPSSLDARSLARRLGELAGDERQAQVEFLLHLDEFDRRRAYLDLGFGSLWEYCREALHLREGAAGRRINAMRVLRRFPGLAGALRDGRLCLSTLSLLGQVLTEENAGELVARAAYRSTAEVDHLVASLRPRPVPREGIRKLALPSETGRQVPPPVTSSSQEEVLATTDPLPAPAELPPALLAPPRPQPVEVRPVSRDHWSLRATVDRSFKEDLETLAMLLSHTVRRGDLAAVLHEAIRCGIEKHGKRRGEAGEEDRGEGVAAEGSRRHPGRGPAPGVGAGRRTLCLDRFRWEALRQPLAARGGSRPAAIAGWDVYPR